jgi:hypothetical protein
LPSSIAIDDVQSKLPIRERLRLVTTKPRAGRENSLFSFQ